MSDLDVLTAKFEREKDHRALNQARNAIAMLWIAFIAYAVIDTIMETRLKRVVADTQELVSRIATVQAIHWPETRAYSQTNSDGSVFVQDTNGVIRWYRSVQIMQDSTGNAEIVFPKP